MVCWSINPRDATHENIMETKEFGVNLASAGQNILSSVAGGSSGRHVNKMMLSLYDHRLKSVVS